MTTLHTGATHALLVTPLDADGAFDAKSMTSLVDFVLENGARGVTALGTTGEFFALSFTERVEIVRTVVEAVAGRAPVTVGIGATATATAVALAKETEKAGADCAMVLPPLYFEHTAASQTEHFTAVARATDLPVMIYDGAGGIPVSAAVIAEVASRVDNLAYAKMALPDPSRITALRAAAPSVVPLAGDDTTLVAALRAGAQGSAIATGNIQPREVAAIHEAVNGGDFEEASRIFATSIAPSVMATSTPKNEFIARFKEVLAAMGVIATPTVRLPLRPVEAGDREELLGVMRTLGVL